MVVVVVVAMGYGGVGDDVCGGGDVDEVMGGLGHGRDGMQLV